MTTYFGREQRIRDLMNIIQDERYTRNDMTSILETCLQHIVPHNHNNYTINIHNRYQEFSTQSLDELEGLDEPEPLAHSRPTTQQGNNQDLTSTVQNFVDSIMNEVAGTPSDSVQVHVNGRRTNDIPSTNVNHSRIVPVSLDMMITNTDQAINNLSERFSNLNNLQGNIHSTTSTSNVNTPTSDLNESDGDNDNDDSSPTDASHDSEIAHISENRETTVTDSHT